MFENGFDRSRHIGESRWECLWGLVLKTFYAWPAGDASSFCCRRRKRKDKHKEDKHKEMEQEETETTER